MIQLDHVDNNRFPVPKHSKNIDSCQDERRLLFFLLYFYHEKKAIVFDLTAFHTRVSFSAPYVSPPFAYLYFPLSFHHCIYCVLQHFI